MTETYRIRPAVREDMNAVLGLIEEAARWLQATKGTDQWARPWPDKKARDKRVAQGIDNGLTWMVEDDGGLAGTVTFRKHGTGILWTAAELLDRAVYVSRLIVRREYAGQGIGAALIDWAGQRGMDQWNANWSRVDVWTENLALHEYYKSQGFTHLRTCPFDDNWEYPSAALFQKPAADIDVAAADRFKQVSLVH
jgi:GNAT superfamily N-acetyltransferase